MNALKERTDSKTKRIVYFDILNILAIIAVVAMHCNGIVHGNPLIRAWSSSLFVDCIFYWAVPVFFMLSGATLMKYRERYDTKTFFKKRFVKILVPFVFWIIIMLVWKVNTNQLDFNEISNVKNLINVILTNRVEYTYYFIFDILGIYLTIPLLSLLAKQENEKTLWFTVLLYFIFNATLINILPLFEITYNNSFTVQIGSYVVFVLLGYLLSTQNLTKKQRVILYILAIGGVVYRYVTTFILSRECGEVIRDTWGYCSWHSILLASAVFVFVKELKINNKIGNNSKVTGILSEISSCSFGIYLIHTIVMHYQIQFFEINVYTWQWRTIGIITTYLISLGIVYVLKKVPILKKIVP